MEQWIDILSKFKEKKEPVVLVTVTKCLGSTPCVVGSRMIVTATEDIFGTIGGGKLEFLAIKQAIKALNENKVLELKYTLGPEFEQCCGGQVELIFEPMNQSPQLYVFGAGHIGVEICNILVDTPFEIHLIDSRENWFSKFDLDAQIATHPADPKDFKTFKDVVNWGENCYVLVLTHDHVIDFDIIAMAIQNKTKFVGLIGSKTKRVRFHNMLVNDMKLKDGMDKVVCPIGLPIGGDSPKEIAISAASQLLKVHYEN
ncbi:MAG: xanthine dehydrogenase accessory protein XdhC [Bacteroidia bacterium]|nr:xanthine dehydrogenase accessory protein XdhC [Bacteroidia bacterium]NND25388.1 xanthine dehydrogenase accessory protein XdhC [Flavobacteriaceae bacterium]NNK60275.1 xanthine dehydrogenase accessory protein XdhC [Flavobacteriaceae bacterium]RZW56973.1 MAG: xanthine dehydrogenase accessory protein XdhC [Flavobacteriaceae bacterium]